MLKLQIIQDNPCCFSLQETPRTRDGNATGRRGRTSQVEISAEEGKERATQRWLLGLRSLLLMKAGI
jgi:hypothetical protein